MTVDKVPHESAGLLSSSKTAGEAYRHLMYTERRASKLYAPCVFISILFLYDIGRKEKTR